MPCSAIWHGGHPAADRRKGSSLFSQRGRLELARLCRPDRITPAVAARADPLRQKHLESDHEPTKLLDRDTTPLGLSVHFSNRRFGARWPRAGSPCPAARSRRQPALPKPRRPRGPVGRTEAISRSPRPRGASAFILQFERGFIAVTADHVLQEYSASLEADDRTICQIGNCQVWLERSLVARNAKLDIATFEVVQSQLKDIGADTIDCRGQWPPPNVEVGDTITLTGFLDEQRRRFAANRYDMPAWGAHGIAEAITETDIVTIYEPEHVLTVNTSVPKPPLGLNLSGCSGGPCFLVKTVKGLLRWFPVGLIYRGPRKEPGVDAGEFASFDQIRIRRLHFLKSDGAIEDPDSGWLPP
jgi:hypothetical protein